MSDLQALNDQKRELIAQEVELKNKYQNEGEWGSEREAEFQRIEDKLNGVERSIQVAEREEEVQKAQSKQKDNPADNRSESEIYDQEVFPKLFANKFDYTCLNENERKVVDNLHSRADLGTGSGGGGNLVPTELQNRIIQRMQFMGGVRPVANVRTTPNGNTLNWPYSDNVNDSGEQISENPASDTSQLNPTFSQIKIEAYTYSTKEFLVSNQLLQDTPFDLVTEFEQFAARRIFNVLNPLLTTGSGSGEPEGIVTGANGTTRASSSNSIDRTDFINLIHDLDRAYRNNGAFMLTDNLLSEIRKLEIGSSDSRPLYQTSPRAGEPDRIEGYPFTVNNDLDTSLAADNKVATFGDHSQYFLRDVQGSTMMRLEELHAKRNQTGFVMFERHDGKLLDQYAVRVLQMAST